MGSTTCDDPSPIVCFIEGKSAPVTALPASHCDACGAARRRLLSPHGVARSAILRKSASRQTQFSSAAIIAGASHARWAKGLKQGPDAERRRGNEDGQTARVKKNRGAAV